MPWETVAEEIARLEAERHLHSATFANTSPTDTVTRTHLQDEMDRRTDRIRELQEQRPLGFLTRWCLRGGAGVAVWGAIGLGPWWVRAALGLMAVGLAFFSLG